MAAELEGFELRWGSQKRHALQARPCPWVPAYTIFRTFPTKPASGLQTLVEHPLHAWQFHLAKLFKLNVVLSVKLYYSHFSEMETEAQKSSAKKITRSLSRALGTKPWRSQASPESFPHFTSRPYLSLCLQDEK